MLFYTSVLIDYLRRNDPIAVSHVETVIDGSQVGSCSVITETELWAGIRNRGELLAAVSLIAKFESVPITSSVARRAGDLLCGKSMAQIRSHFGDALIAATAIESGETILTADASSQRVFGGQATYLVYR
ncbi:MAG: type II toxin-antitoxin system VapC family toxin [Dehalococcoidia bacterium]|nr:type II toxin-antitoxin system VapC family toxin [Dehalococcoidia bacterium]MSQ16020.1 type II toxin-antitoxin system VapC family toxin [Dehalococcoidia bacterium]